MTTLVPQPPVADGARNRTQPPAAGGPPAFHPGDRRRPAQAGVRRRLGRRAGEGVERHRGQPRRLDRVAPVWDLDGPRVRLGLVWGAVLITAGLASPLALAAVLAVTALAAGGQAARAWPAGRRRSGKPWRPAVTLGPALVVIVAAAGLLPMVLAVLALGAASVAGARRHGHSHPGRTLFIAVAVAGGAAAPVVLRTELGGLEVLVYLLQLAAWDASNFLIGSGASNRVEGPLAGAAAVGSISLLAAAVLVPPFGGTAPWLLGAAMVIAAPLGPWLASLLLPRAGVWAPALRRLDTGLVAGPVWLTTALLLL